MKLQDKINQILNRKHALKPDDFFKDKKVMEDYLEMYNKVEDVRLSNLTSKQAVQEKLAEYLHTDLKIVSIEYGRLTLPPKTVRGYYDTGANLQLGKMDIDHVWKIDVERNGQNISLATINGDLAVFQSKDNVLFNAYSKDYQFDDKNQAITTHCRVTGGAWNETEITKVVPQFRYDGEQIELVGATEIKGFDYHGNGGGSFKETERKAISAEDFNKIRCDYETMRQQNIASTKNITCK
ncbi:MAG: hypothetical protein IJS26_02560 [Alphaproteobacteria bacterium]|nr:hypothetical protein [Alphaproteobacteria bacterium]